MPTNSRHQRQRPRPKQNNGLQFPVIFLNLCCAVSGYSPTPLPRQRPGWPPIIPTSAEFIIFLGYFGQDLVQYQAELRNSPVLRTGICEFFRLLSDYNWAGAAFYCKSLRDTSDPSACRAELAFISQDRALCLAAGCMPPDSTVLHQLAHTHPKYGAADDWVHYDTILEFVGWACFCAPWLEIRNGKFKTPLQMAAAGGNQSCMLMVFAAEAGR